MAIYSTFFVCSPEQLISGFPGWRLPLAKPVKRQVKNPFTGEMMNIETTAPEWHEDDDPEMMDREYQVVAGTGNYQDYLEGRLPPLVQRQPHWAAKGITNIELEPLARTLGVEGEFECPLFSPPSSGKVLHEFPAHMAAELVLLDEPGQQRVAEAWAAAMSTQEYTHSVCGERVSDDWVAADAMHLLEPIADLARQMRAGHRMYLLIEA